MRIPRCFAEMTLTTGQELVLPDEVAHHIARVLRMQVGSEICLFNGDGQDYRASLTEVGKRSASARIDSCEANPVESPVQITLCQGISKGDRMDFAIQKAVELGVTAVQPVQTARSVVKLNQDRLEKKRLHWQGVADHACEQSGRSVRVEVRAPISLDQWFSVPKGIGLVLDPTSELSLAALAGQQRVDPLQDVELLIGPEGGLSDEEVVQSKAAGCLPVTLGPRILRTETAALAALTAVQMLWGDLT